MPIIAAFKLIIHTYHRFTDKLYGESAMYFAK